MDRLIMALPDIPSADPRAGYLALKTEIDAAIADVLSQACYSLGPVVERFEAAFAAYCGVEHGIGVNSGTDAIHLALRGLGIGRGDEVITVSHTFVATVSAVEMAGAQPVLVDVDPAYWTIDPAAVAAAITPRTKAVIAVHLYGQPADLNALQEVCTRHGLALIEDCAQAHGASWNGKPVGSFGSASCFSFYPTKNIGTVGDGGMIVCSDAALAERLRALRQYGWERPQYSVVPGWNSRLGPLQAGILQAKLTHLDSVVERRRAIAGDYLAALEGLPLALPRERNLSRHAYHLFVVRTEGPGRRNALVAHLSRLGIAAGVHYRTPVHQQPAYADRLPAADLALTEELSSSILSLPMYPELTDAQSCRVAAAVQGFFGAAQ